MPSIDQRQSGQLADSEPGSVPYESLAVAQCDHLSVVTLAGILGRDKPTQATEGTGLAIAA